MIKLKSLLVEEKLRLAIPADIRQLYTLFKKNGYQLYLVGGAVRDAILGSSPKDFDLATDAKPDDVEKMVQDAGFKTYDVGKSFGVVIVSGHEIATFRKDIGKGRRPSSVDYTDIKGDVMRRDLTINSLFYDIGKGEIVDLTGGIADLKKKRIRTVGDPELRFDEDPLRKLRAVRFTGSIGGKMDRDTYNAIRKDPSLTGVSYERVRDEFVKGIQKAKSPPYYLKLLLELGLMKLILPGFNVMTRFANTNDHIVQLANMLQVESYGKITNGLKSLKYQNKEVINVAFLLKLYNFTPDDIYNMKKEQEATTLKKNQVNEWSKITGMGSKMMKVWNYKLSIKARDVMAQGFKGSQIGIKMKELETNKFLGKR